MDWQPFINVGLGAISAVFGWVARTFYTDIRALESSIAAHKVEVARDYATNQDLQVTIAEKRFPQAPEIPTMQEQGLKTVTASSWKNSTSCNSRSAVT